MMYQFRSVYFYRGSIINILVVSVNWHVVSVGVSSVTLVSVSTNSRKKVL